MEIDICLHCNVNPSWVNHQKLGVAQNKKIVFSRLFISFIFIVAFASFEKNI